MARAMADHAPVRRVQQEPLVVRVPVVDVPAEHPEPLVVRVPVVAPVALVVPVVVVPADPVVVVPVVELDPVVVVAPRAVVVVAVVEKKSFSPRCRATAPREHRSPREQWSSSAASRRRSSLRA